MTIVDANLIEGSLRFRSPADAPTVSPKFAALAVVALLAQGGPTVAQQLPGLARALVPVDARSSLDREDLRVKDCGLSPTYPCVSAFFVIRGTFARRLAALRSQSRRAGWRIVRSRPVGTGMSLELQRGQFHARYLVERTERITGLDVYGPANVLTRPSAEERARWSSAKRRYISQADAVCARTIGRIRASKDLAPAVTKADSQLRGLHPPSGEQARVNSFLRPLHALVQAAKQLRQAKGEDALPAAVALGEYAKRFERAAARYGLIRCTFH